MGGLLQLTADSGQQWVDQGPQIKRVVEPERCGQQLAAQKVRSPRLGLGDEPPVLERSEDPVELAFRDTQPDRQVIQGEALRRAAKFLEDAQRAVHAGHCRPVNLAQ